MDDMNSTVMAEYKIDEVYAALKDMTPVKAPGVDDTSKAYNIVECEFFRKMSRMSFADSWISIIMKCINSVSYAVEITGEVGEVFKSEGGSGREIG
ncbi:reverse transcriptase [Gossypium australe]|uniref:Reverse transcriptase n=1 Tax=Gossypium australe TaxID=47621 RepID=A0A5B6UI14_9ROSI|nr:reverse transcriptase [Gossypium australe]